MISHSNFFSSPVTQLVDIHPATTDDDFRAWMLRYRPLGSLYATIGGYDFDARELWQIPEVSVLCQRVIKVGLASLLEPNIGDQRIPQLLGSADVFALAHRLHRDEPGVGATFDLPPSVLRQYQDAMHEARVQASRTMSGPRG